MMHDDGETAGTEPSKSTMTRRTADVLRHHLDHSFPLHAKQATALLFPNERPESPC